jgi:hypothetical protein
MYIYNFQYVTIGETIIYMYMCFDIYVHSYHIRSYLLHSIDPLHRGYRSSHIINK